MIRTYTHSNMHRSTQSYTQKLSCCDLKLRQCAQEIGRGDQIHFFLDFFYNTLILMSAVNLCSLELKAFMQQKKKKIHQHHYLCWISGAGFNGSLSHRMSAATGTASNLTDSPSDQSESSPDCATYYLLV